MGVGEEKRQKLISEFNNQLLPWKSLVYGEVENASNYGSTGGDIAAIFYLVDPDGKIRFKRVVDFDEAKYRVQQEIDTEISKLCSEFGIGRRR